MGGKKTVGVIHNEAFLLLQKNYKMLWIIALISVGISLVVGTLVQVITTPLSMLAGLSSLPMSLAEGHIRSPEDLLYWFAPALGMMSILYLLLVAVSILSEILTNAAQLGTYNATLELIDGRKPTFQAEWNRFAANWKRYLAVYAWITLWTTLWSLLFIVPGIVKWYSYRMAPMLVLRYPEMEPREAIRLSQHMTTGYKGRLFVLDLILFLYGLASIIGICVFVVGIFAIQILWILPMQLGMYAVVYRDILQAAIDAGHMPAEI